MKPTLGFTLCQKALHGESPECLSFSVTRTSSSGFGIVLRSVVGEHVHAISSDANIKIWLEPEVEIASVLGHVNPALLNELLREVRRNEQLYKDAWDLYLG